MSLKSFDATVASLRKSLYFLAGGINKVAGGISKVAGGINKNAGGIMGSQKKISQEINLIASSMH
jgi:X-X-X-Leu-X-X-Gly heptad repeat protein